VLSPAVVGRRRYNDAFSDFNRLYSINIDYIASSTEKMGIAAAMHKRYLRHGAPTYRKAISISVLHIIGRHRAGPREPL
jgi:hypothetical protein